MKDIVEKYIHSISIKFSYEETTEMGYRTDFENLLKGIFEGEKINRFDHDAKSERGNKPDFVVRKNDIPVLYIEAKDIGVSLDKVEKSEQMSRYFGYANLILTDYVEFRFYRNGILYGEPIKIADYDLKSKLIKSYPEKFEYLIKTLIDFTKSHKEPIKSGKHLAKIMGGKAQRIRDNIRVFLKAESEHNEELMKVFETIRRLLVHDLTEDSFADLYAQTLVYGLFAARYHDDTPDTFTRQEARDLIPKSNPLLQHFFDHIVGPNFDKRLEYIVDELCEVFSHANVSSLMSDYFKKDSYGDESGPDPVIHFYEDFLREYDEELRKKMGAYYTPLPVVNFIIRSVDFILKKDFVLNGGLADTSKLANGNHKVQILDPAVGTGTFISSVIDNIYGSILAKGQSGRWPTYVHNELLPRIHGFELMMAPYTIAHLKIAMTFKERGFKYFHRRLGIYLTNSLEETPTQDKLFTAFGLADSIVNESKEAFKVKNNTPIMVVIGNPPYSVSSSNKGEWIQNMIKVYKKDLNERKINLDDDYIKFIRFSEHFIEKNQSGIVAMITNNSFIDGITHRQMRKHLLETFDDIYILDLHGNSKKKETAPDGGKDENVFNIQQGVSINIFIRKEKVKKELGKVHHADIYGKRENKFKILNESSLQSIKWNNLHYSEPTYFFIPRNFTENDDYKKGFKINEMMKVYNSGIQTKNDQLAVQENLHILEEIIANFKNLSISQLKDKYNRKESSGWNFESAKKDLLLDHSIVKYQYRPFDYRWLCYTGRSGGFIGRSRNMLMSNFLRPNLGLAIMKQFFQQIHYNHVLVTNSMVDERTLYSNRGGTYLFPLYLYSIEGYKKVNFNEVIFNKIVEIVGTISPENLVDYIYAVLNSPHYRKKYADFLKTDFPQIPYPKDAQTFKKLVSIGAELRSLHLMESSNLNKYITTYPEDGSNIVEKITYKDGNIFINEKQYFGKVPEVAWNFYIGGYQPAQKWLKDRKGRELTNEDIEHYQKIIVALVETDILMKKIDEIDFL